MKRVPQVELLDTDAGTPDEVAASLADLRRINRWFGGIATSRYLLQSSVRRCGPDKVSLLEVAAGDGFAISRAARGFSLDLTLFDRSGNHLNGTGQKHVVGDALNLPFADASFDLVSCALFVHHLGPEEAVRFFRESLRVARVAVLVNDLRRSYPHLLLIYCGMPLFRSRITRHDSVASVLQSYTPHEMQTMLREAGASEVEVTNKYLYRMAVIGWK